MELTEDLIYYWLHISGLSARRANRLLSVFSLHDLWEEIGRGITDKSLLGDRLESLVRFRNDDYLQGRLRSLQDAGVSFVTRTRFPEKLLQPEVDPPLLLYYRGDLSLLDTDGIAMVGTRACSVYGREAATRLATDLCARGLTIVSGLATGIDTYAHRAALKAGGKTIAVLGSGLFRISPAGNATLAEEIAESGGLVLSEYEPSFEGMKYSFPERNRLISGLSLGVIVVEAGLKSGALITSSFAAEQNRYVFAVPGTIFSRQSLGTNRLLYDGAVPALSADDVCDTMRLSVPEIDAQSRAIQLDIFEQKIYNLLQSGDESFDSLVEKCEFPPQKLSALLSGLEIKGIIRKKQANLYTTA